MPHRTRDYLRRGRRRRHFPQADCDLSTYRRCVDAVKVPVLANLTEFGQTPLFTRSELASARFAMQLYPLAAFRAP